MAGAQGQTFPVFQQDGSGKTGKKSAGKRKAQNGIQADVAVDAEKLSGVVPVAFAKKRIKQPAGKQFHNSPDAGGIEKAEQGVLSLGVEQDENQDSACPVDGKPRAVEKTTVAEFPVFYQKNQHFP